MTDRGNIYQKLILIAKDKLDEQGTLPRSLAELAALADIEEAEVQNNFTSIDDLREGLFYQAVVLLNDELRRGVLDAGIESPDAQLRSLARSYAKWADGNPALFRLLVEGLNGPVEPDSTLYRFTISMRDLIARKLNEMRDLGQLRKDTDIPAILILLHCLIKGAGSVLASRDRDPWIKEDPRPTQQIAWEMFDYCLDSLLASNAPAPDSDAAELEMIRR